MIGAVLFVLFIVAGSPLSRTRDCKPVIGRIVAAAVIAVALAAAATPNGRAHRDPCHTQHVCPSDHATYRWRGLWCVSPTARERTARFKKRVVYARLIYYCHA